MVGVGMIAGFQLSVFALSANGCNAHHHINNGRAPAAAAAALLPWQHLRQLANGCQEWWLDNVRHTRECASKFVLYFNSKCNSKHVNTAEI